MKLIIAGSRTIGEEAIKLLDKYVLPGLVEEVVCGGAKGGDEIGKAWAQFYDIPVVTFMPDWENLGKGAGILRNIKMGNYATHLVALWDGHSRGTKHMIEYMRSLNKPVQVILVADKGIDEATKRES